MDHAVQQMRDRNLLGNLPLEASLWVLHLVDRYHATADALYSSYYPIWWPPPDFAQLGE